jgi:hypothetical protein
MSVAMNWKCDNMVFLAKLATQATYLVQFLSIFVQGMKKSASIFFALVILLSSGMAQFALHICPKGVLCFPKQLATCMNLQIVVANL